jgi:hypothetical protein
MDPDNSRHIPYGHPNQHHEEDCPHDHHLHQAEESSISPKEQLIIRLRRIIRHNHEHAATYRSMAEEAQRIGMEAAARWILEVAEQNARQNMDLEKALVAVKFQA